MNRVQGWLYLTSFVVVVVGSDGCSKTTPGPTGPTAPSGPVYTISGVITGYHGGPLSGASVGDGNGWVTTQTDQQGRYTFSTPETRELDVRKAGYMTARKYSLPSHDSTLNFALHTSVKLAYGDTLAGTVWGDQFMAGDDVLFGGLCAHTACQLVALSPIYPLSDQVEVRLRWNDPTRQLALYISREGDFEFLPVPPPAKSAERYCCSSELVAVFRPSNGFFEDEPDVAVAFEQAAGGMPGPSDSQRFELAVRPLP